MNFTEFEKLIEATKGFAQEGAALVYIVAMMVGAYLIFDVLSKVVKKGDARASSQEDMGWGPILARAFMASCMITLARMMSFFQETNGSVDAARAVLAYAAPTGGPSGFTLIYSTLALWCVFIGTIGFFRGFLLFDKASQGGHGSGDAFWRGLWHVIFGALTVQIFS